MSKEITKKKLNRVLNLFVDKVSDYKPKEYKSYSTMRRMNGSYTIKLMFGYNKSRNPVYSDEIEVNDFELFVEFMSLLDSGLNREVATSNVFDDIEDESEDW